MHAYVIGEHGDSEFVPWSQAMLAAKPILDICDESDGRCRYNDLEQISEEVRGAAQKIIKAKHATYYGIGMAMVRITKAVFGNENSVLTVSAMLCGEYGMNDVYIGVPAIIGRNGVKKVLELSLAEEEKEKLLSSCNVLKEAFDELELY